MSDPTGGRNEFTHAMPTAEEGENILDSQPSNISRVSNLADATTSPTLPLVFANHTAEDPRNLLSTPRSAGSLFSSPHSELVQRNFTGTSRLDCSRRFLIGEGMRSASRPLSSFTTTFSSPCSVPSSEEGRHTRVLCVMTGIHTHSRSKDVLYNILASFYFTQCEKLGKRVSKSTLVENEIRRTSEMLMALPSNRSKTASVRRATATAGPQVAVPRTVEEKKRPVPAAKDPCAAPAAKKHTVAAATAATTTVHSSEAEDSGEVLDIAYATGVFATTTHARPLQSSSPSSDSWEPAELERRVASIVQLYDPVTATMVVKKLNQMGYRDDGAQAVVEAILRRFHQRQLIFYDSDIAYLL